MRVYLLVWFCAVLAERCCRGASIRREEIGDDAEELVSVVVLYRHGDRAPSKSFPNDPYFDESFWPMGHGQLTNKGKERLYQLGKWLRSHYGDLLPETYSPKDIYVRSTNVDRCLMSAASALAGLYPPDGSQKWNPDMPWQPIPVHTTSSKNDEVLSMRKECSKYKEMYRNAMESDYFKSVQLIYADFLKLISELSGADVTDLEEVRILHTVLESYASYNASFLPTWVQFLDKKTLIYLAGIAHGRYTFNLELKRLLTGPFWSNLFAHFDNVINNMNDTPKFIMLAAHDTTIVSLLNTMGVYDLVPPTFGATLMWELRRTYDGMRISIFYKRNDTEFDVLISKGCETSCNYWKFKNVMEPVTVDFDAWEEECGNADIYGLASLTAKKLVSNKLGQRRNQKPFIVD